MIVLNKSNHYLKCWDGTRCQYGYERNYDVCDNCPYNDPNMLWGEDNDFDERT